MAQEQPSRAGPILDIRVRWRAGQWCLALAGGLAVWAAWRPLAPGASPRLRLVVTLLLGLGTCASALLASLKGRKHWELWAFYAFILLSLDALGQMIGPFGWPGWPLIVLAIGGIAVDEAPAVAYAFAALASALATADAAHAGLRTAWKAALAATIGYSALVLVVQTAERFLRLRLAAALDENDRLRFGLDVSAPLLERPGHVETTRLLRSVSEEGRRALKQERAAEVESLLVRLVGVARASLKAHAVLFFDIDREREVARLRAAAGPDSLKTDAVVPLSQDPFAFVVERGVPFYATDFKRLLWELPYYKQGTKLGTLMAAPVRTGSAVSAVLIADKAEIQSFTGDEPDILDGYAGMAADAIVHAREAVGREESGLEFHAVYRVSERLARATRGQTVRKVLLEHAAKLVAFEGAAFAMTDERQTRYFVLEAHGWAQPFEGREVALTERTWAAWVLRGNDEALLIDDLTTARDKMPTLVLDEDKTGAESLLIVPLRVGLGDEEGEDTNPVGGATVREAARDSVQPISLIGAFVLTGKRGVFDATARRVLSLFANQAAATLYHIQLKDRERSNAARDGLTGLYNRRAFDEFLRQARAVEDRRGGGGRFSLLLLDIDHFKKLNDTYGHPAGDAALRSVARSIQKLIRGADVAARYGGEEFAVIMPGSDETGAAKLAERIRRGIEKEHVIFGGARIVVTASLGVAEWPRHGQELKEILGATDKALYAAKQAGRNRVFSASSLPLEKRAEAVPAAAPARD